MEDKQLLEQQLAGIQGEILIAEKQLKSLQGDIENHERVKGDSLKEYDTQIKNKKEEIDSLELEGARLRRLIILEGESYEAIKEEKIKESEKWAQDAKDAEEAVKSIYSNADNRIRAVADREANCENAERQNLADSTKNREMAENLQKEADSIEIQRAIVKKSREELSAAEEKSKLTLAEEKEKLDDITRQIPIQTAILEKIKRDIEENTDKASAILKNADDKMRKADERSLILNMRDRRQNERENEQSKKEAWLDDREGTVGRAYKEVIQRGGIIKEETYNG